jgi:hypothetical protein
MNDKSIPANSPRWRIGPDDPQGADMVPPRTPCPFCGSSEAFFYEYAFSKEFAVACRQCGAQGPRRRSPRLARELWETRHQDGPIA